MTEQEILKKAKEYGYSNLFALNKDFTTLQDYADRFTGSERAVAYTMMGLTVNTMAYQLAKIELGITDDDSKQSNSEE